MSGLYDIPLQRIDGSEATLSEHRGKVLLVVNVASKCGLTPQYDGLEALHKTYSDQGLAVLGFPANEFAGQEPGSNDEIMEFCRLSYGVDFPMYAKLVVKGEGRHPLYDHLVGEQPSATPNPDGQLRANLEKHGLAPQDATDVMWNFEKFLISRDGKVVGRFAPDVVPESPMLTSAIEAELASGK